MALYTLVATDGFVKTFVAVVDVILLFKGDLVDLAVCRREIYKCLAKFQGLYTYKKKKRRMTCQAEPDIAVQTKFYFPSDGRKN